MAKPEQLPTSPDDTKRFTTLRRYGLENAEGEPFKAIVDLAKQLFGVPLAGVSLVEDLRPWFKASYGLTDDALSEASFYARTILKDEVTVVDDAADDERFAANPLVTGEPGVRFYAGAPLVTPNGYTLGTFCIFDTKPRKRFAQKQRELLQDLAALTVSEVARRLKGGLASETTKQPAYYDEATGLPTAPLLYDRLQQALLQAKRADKVVAVLAIGVERVDVPGDPGGASEDYFFRKVAERLERTLRASDTLARIGPSEFIAVLPLSCNKDSASVVERILHVVATPLSLGGDTLPFELRVGVSLARDNSDAKAQIKAAQTALSAVEASTGKRYHYAQDTLTHLFEERLELSRDLRRAVSDNEFELYFQPRVDALSGASVGAEALVRWHHPERGLLLPGGFLPLAERIDLAPSVDKWTVQSVCEQLAAWAREDFPLRLSCNLAAASFEADGFAARLIRQLSNLGEAAERFELEITENLLIKDIGRAAGQLIELKAAVPGIKIAIDDFGTGHSSLAYLRHLPADVLKIDRLFVRDLDHADARTRATALSVVRTIVTLAHDLGLNVVAEGVETVTQLDILTSLACDEVQGYYFSKPLPLETLQQVTAPDGLLPLGRQEAPPTFADDS